MIQAKMVNNVRTKSLSLTLKGHAGYAVAGSDNVFASASILAYTLLQNLSKARIARFASLEPGDSVIECKCLSEEEYAKADSYFGFTFSGLELLSDNYPDYVSAKSMVTAE